METSGKIQFNEDDPNHHDHHQDPQEDHGHPPSMGTFLNHYDHHQDPLDDKGHPPSMGRFLTTIFLLTPQVFLEISDKIQFNEDDPNHFQKFIEIFSYS